MTVENHKLYTASGEFYGHLRAEAVSDGSFRLSIQDTGPVSADEQVWDERGGWESFYNSTARFHLGD
jgi:hypothetical protein